MSSRKHRHHKRKLYKRPGFYVLMADILFVCFGLFWLFRIKFLPNIILIMFITIEGLFLVLLWYLLLYRHRRWMKIIGYILSACLILGNCVESYYMYVTWTALERMTSPKQEQGDYVELYVLKDSLIYQPEDLNERTIGILSNMDTSQAQLMTDWLSEQGVQYEMKEYDSSLQMARDLKGAAIDAIVLYQPYLSVIESYEGLDDFNEGIRSIHQIQCSKVDIGQAEQVDVTKSPFTVLVSGIDTFGEIGSSGRSDVNLLLTVNPVSRQIMIISTPRDFFVEMACEEGAGCPAGQRDKLTHVGMYGIASTEKTLEELYGITINYNIRVNFSTVIKVIDELGGVDVNNVDSFTTGRYDFEPGIVHMNGDMALSFARERYAFVEGDRERGRNQMRVVEAMIQKALSPQILENYSGILNAVADSVQMNLTTDDIAKLVNMQLSNPSSWIINMYSVNGSDGNEFAPSIGDNAYVMWPDEETVTRAKQDILAVLHGEKPLYIGG